MAGISFSGLASGVDIASMIDQLVAVDSVPLTTIKNRQASIENKKSVWNEVNSAVLGLQEALTKVSKTILGGSFTSSIGNDNIIGVSATNSSATGSYSINVKQLAQNLVISSDVFDGNIGINGDITINDGQSDFSIQVEENDTLISLSKKINNLNGNINSYVIDGRLVVSHKKSGDDSKISFIDSNNILSTLGVVNSEGTLKNINQEAKQSIVSVNGIEVSRNSNQVSDLIPGLSLNLKSVGETVVSIEDDIDSMVSSINDFIKAYNDTVNLINTKLSEEVPENATSSNKKGLLRGNTSLSSMKYSFRNTVLSAIDSNSAFKYLRNIGIDVSKDNFGKDGTLQLVDETKLREVLKNDRQSVANLLIQDKNDNGTLDENDSGLLASLNKYINTLSGSDGFIAKTIESLDASIKSLDKDIERKELLIEKKRERYEKQFTNMEKRISSINSNGEYLLNSLSSLLGQ